MSETETLTLDDELVDLEEDEESSESEETEEEKPKPERRQWRGSCPMATGPHVIEVRKPPRHLRPLNGENADRYVCVYCEKDSWTPGEIEELIINPLLREDSNREMCKECIEKDPELLTSSDHNLPLPYGEETGHVEWKPQYDKDTGEAILDSEGHQLYVAFPELKCAMGHRWYKGEGPRRDLRGRHPILFETHLYNRRRRELLAKEGVVDPAYTMDRWGKRPTVGLYVRSHPQGRKTNTPEQRRDHGAGFYKRFVSKPRFTNKNAIVMSDDYLVQRKETVSDLWPL